MKNCKKISLDTHIYEPVAWYGPVVMNVQAENSA